MCVTFFLFSLNKFQCTNFFENIHLYSNLGLNIAYRVLENHKDNSKITFVLSSRTEARFKGAAKLIETYANSLNPPRTIQCNPLILDLTDMQSILGATQQLRHDYDHINYLFVNAAQGVCDGINWFKAAKEFVVNPVKAVTDPGYRIENKGLKSKDEMGYLFQANVFGPHYLIYKVLKLLALGRATIVWVSSIRSKPASLAMDDLELLRSESPYESSKRLIDVLQLATYKELKNLDIYQYVVQPGIFISQATAKHLNWFTYYGMLLMFYIARVLGSYWHNIDGYRAANAPVYVTTFLDRDFERQDIKYGSATYSDGVEYIKPQEIDPEGKMEVYEFFKDKRSEWDRKLNC
ncbi:hypothetical protein KAFR_0B05590 [Kazachstania africana CBS 2517]|uniref:3beta-hydroxysteroid 3-dehydrogenase n=1 Tax=Kazachstania africana (strain ATCC 22294 / BCRC 22015 / CBS 2517 / CECT 1963 / NBRC 1671 / NRRL Y-8276) TaxID=1071382 RepID=H2AR54_KAZAF|nr:hypothetical protein KAFR_0B05590 [Kazachstania africana CBS 2517]CCF56854.1 hypothetical protein KAFR_0B05590 [Kazachstania africana CBS 2517]